MRAERVEEQHLAYVKFQQVNPWLWTNEMLGGNSRYLSVTLSSALVMRTLIVNTKLGFHSGATAPTQATLASRQKYWEQRIIHSQLFFPKFLLQVFGGTSGPEISDFNWNLFSQNMEAGKPWEMHFMLSICQVEEVVVVGTDRRRSIFFIYGGDLSCEYLGYVIIVIIHWQTILEIARTVYGPAPQPQHNI